MLNPVISEWCEGRVRLVQGLLDDLVSKDSQLPVSEQLNEHHRRVEAAKTMARDYIARIDDEPQQMYDEFPHDLSQLQVGRLFVPVHRGVSSLPWKHEELTTLLALLAVEAEAIADEHLALNKLARTKWLLEQLRDSFAKFENHPQCG